MYRNEYIDLAILGGDAGEHRVVAGIEAALAHRPRGLCLNPAATATPAVQEGLARLREAGVLRQFVIDFPLGQGGVAAKVGVAEGLLRLAAADEFDVVANIAALLDDSYATFTAEVRPLVALGTPVKVIVETGYYPDDDMVLRRAVDWCVEVGAHAIKTSTGVIRNVDNTVKRRHVALWRARIAECGYVLGIKDAGGKRTREDIDLAIEAGATIVGSSQVIE